MGKQTAVTTTEAFLGLIEKSGVLTSAAWEKAQQACSGQADPKMAAKILVRDKVLTVWQAKQLLGGYSALKFAKYKLLSELGNGRLGRVFFAEHAQLGRRVALKMLSRRHSDNPETIQRFLKQAREICALDHRNLIHVYDVASEADRYYLVMEYASGRDLQTLVTENGPLSPARAAELIRQAADGLVHAHGRGVVHRDIKPTNVFVDDQGGVKLFDVGVAKLSEAVESPSEGETAPAIPDNELPYIAPEHRGAGAAGEPASDIFSLGAVLFFALTGQPPVDAETLAAKKSSVSETLKALNDAAPDDLVQLTEKMLAADPKARPASATEIVAAVEKWLASHANESTTLEAIDNTVAAASDTSALDKSSEEIASPIVTPAPRRKLPRAKSMDDSAPATKAADSNPMDFLIDTGKASANKTPVEKSDDEKSSSETEVGPFVINTKAKTSSSRGKPAQKKGVATEPTLEISVDVSDKPKLEAVNETVSLKTDASNPAQPKGKTPTKSKSKKGSSNQTKLIIGLIGGGIALVLVVTVALVMILGGKPAQVATKETPKDSQATVAATTKDEDAQKKEESTPSPKPDVAQEKEKEKTEDKTTEPKTEPMPPTEPAVTLPPANNSPPDKPAEPPPADKPADPPSAANVAANAVGLPSVATPATPPVDPAPPVTPPTPATVPPPAAAGEPFAKVANFINLLAFTDKATIKSDALQPQKIAEFQLSNNKTQCLVDLLGGADAVKGKQAFAMDNSEGGTALRDWDISLRDEGAESGGVLIAHLKLDGNNLMFNWLPGAESQAAAPFLCNCLLRFRSAKSTKVVQLRESVLDAKPVVIDFAKSTLKEDFKLPFAPEPDKIKVELSVEGPMQPSQFDKKQAIDAAKDSTAAIFGGTEEDKIVALKIDSLTGSNRVVSLNVAAFIRIATSEQPIKFSQAILKKLQKEMPIEVRRRQVLAKAYDDSHPGDKKKDETFQARLRGLQEDVKKGDLAMQQVEKLPQLMEQMNKTTKVHARLIYEAEGQKIVLLSTTGTAAPEKK